ncbi:DEAD/DEAH box helicase [Corynebacterium tapiri]|uniref:DEAD/DEAH box helicase n=1 Tax=Corynebacterium tapiri TaxID=1448266 RepID=A0A5C4U496_9CORY|nr:DEAD/DEAH box helicase [Corynebacterium tapiri]TNL97345.1 DEAD/DEAH box helicase [Corynebacterium tapiri]
MAGQTLGQELIEAAQKRFPESHLTHPHTIEPRAARYGDWPDWVLGPLQQRLIDAGISRPYIHQVAVAEAAFGGHDVIVSTGTSSGKSLGYQLPILTTLATHPRACALYLTPTKALGSDQLQALTRLISGIDELANVHPAPYDGDTPTEARSTIRDHSRLVFSNPDMVHSSLLGAHERWGRFFRNLQYIVIDECHSYRGVFGANVALVIRRLLRIAARYGAHPVIILASATVADPADGARRLTGRDEILAVTEDGSAQGERTVALWEPGFIEGAQTPDGTPIRRAATTEAAGLMAVAIREGARTLTFVRSRRAAEIVALRTQEELSAMGRLDFAHRVAPYRAGYLADDRRELERKLDDGSLLGVATTNALEMGIDVGGLDAVVTAGFPGTVASFWQQAGRAGRRGQGSLVALVARDDPMDTYLVHHPEALLGRPVERSVFNPANPYLLRGHLYCAAVEAPLTQEEVTAFQGEQVVGELLDMGLLRKRPQGYFAAPRPHDDSDLPTPDTAHSAVAIRGGAGQEVMIVDMTDSRLLGTVDAARAAAQVHTGAVYLHQGESFVIEELDLDNYLALARPDEPEYTTSARSTTDIRILGEPDQLISYGAGLWVANVEVEVSDRVTGYVVRFPDGTVGEHIPLDLPEQRLVTRAVAYTVDPLVLTAAGITAGEIPGALHAAEHAAIGLLPLLATCDRWDIGGVSTALHADTGLPTVFVYDGHPGGAGFADEGFRRFPEWIAATYRAVRACECESGCPSCVQSPKCGNGNNPLDKQAALRLLDALHTLTSSEGQPAR